MGPIDSKVFLIVCPGSYRYRFCCALQNLIARPTQVTRAIKTKKSVLCKWTLRAMKRAFDSFRSSRRLRELSELFLQSTPLVRDLSVELSQVLRVKSVGYAEFYGK